MTDQDNSELMAETGEEEDTPENFFIDILAGNKESASAKKLLVQKVLRQLIEGYGFSRSDLEIDYKPRVQGHGRKQIDIAVFQPDAVHTNENLQRIIVCVSQKNRDKLRTYAEAEADTQSLQGLMELLPNVSLGMWTNGQEEFMVRVEQTRFETKLKPIGIWPAPAEGTTDIDKTGGVTQFAADAEGLEDALSRCLQYLNRNLGLDHKDAFKQLAVLLFAKMCDETKPVGERLFWIRGEEPYNPEGQEAIATRIHQAVEQAKEWQSGLLARGWDLNLESHETAVLVKELARYALRDTQPKYRIMAFRNVARRVMDGTEGRYPTPLNVAELAVSMLDPTRGERVLDCSCGTGTFLAMTAEYIFRQHLLSKGLTPEAATNGILRDALAIAEEWVEDNAFGCDIDPFLAVTSRMNLLFTSGNTGRVYRLDSRTYPDGDLDGNAAAMSTIPLGSMDIALLNPWFSTKDTVTDPAILNRFELGNTWTPDGEGGYRNTGNLNAAGIPPEVLFIERALQWVKPGTGRVGILLPDGILGNPGDEYIRWWILRHCEVLASVDLPIEPFKVTVKEYGLTPALPSLLILRRRSQQELNQPKHPDYKVFMAVVDRAGVDARGNTLFQRSPEGEEIIFNEEVVERIRHDDRIEIRRTVRRDRRIHDELPLVAEKYKEFCKTGEVTL